MAKSLVAVLLISASFILSGCGEDGEEATSVNEGQSTVESETDSDLEKARKETGEAAIAIKDAASSVADDAKRAAKDALNSETAREIKDAAKDTIEKISAGVEKSAGALREEMQEEERQVEEADQDPAGEVVKPAE